jgi:ferrous iron transport protein B
LAFLFRGQPAWKAGLSLALLYVGGLFVGGLVSQFLHRTLKKDRNSFFMMELPLYRQPKLSVVFNSAWTKTLGYIKRAGPPIFTFALLVWIGTTFPNYKAENDQLKLETSYAGQLGQSIEPVFVPMGVDWRVGVSLISAFAAREVFASSLAVIFNVTAKDDSSMQAGLLDSMSSAKDTRGHQVFTMASVIAILVFVMIALQCTSTTAIVIRETGKVSWAISQVVAYNVLAYILAIGAFRLFS